MCYILLKKSRRRRTRKQRRVWVRDIFKNREQQGCYNNLIQEIRLGDSESQSFFDSFPRISFTIPFFITRVTLVVKTRILSYLFRQTFIFPQNFMFVFPMLIYFFQLATSDYCSIFLFTQFMYTYTKERTKENTLNFKVTHDLYCSVNLSSVTNIKTF